MYQIHGNATISFVLNSDTGQLFFYTIILCDTVVFSEDRPELKGLNIVRYLKDMKGPPPHPQQFGLTDKTLLYNQKYWWPFSFLQINV